MHLLLRFRHKHVRGARIGSACHQESRNLQLDASVALLQKTPSELLYKKKLKRELHCHCNWDYLNSRYDGRNPWCFTKLIQPTLLVYDGGCLPVYVEHLHLTTSLFILDVAYSASIDTV